MAGVVTSFHKAIVATISYFDIFEYPLTAVELYKWLYHHQQLPVSFAEVWSALTDRTLAGVIENKNGFYFLAGHQAMVATRLERYRISETKWRIARRAARWIRWLAFVELVAVCNNIGYNNGRADSDIDFFVVVRHGRLWWSRLGVTLLLTALRLRRHGRHATNRVCLSFYVADNHLNLADIALNPHDPYLVYWLATLSPVYDRGGVYEQLLNQNSWRKQYLPNFYSTTLSERRRVFHSSLIGLVKSIGRGVFGGWLGDRLEVLVERIQRPRIDRYFGPAVAAGNTNVVISAAMLKFHKTDRRDDYRQRWYQKIAHLGS